MTSKRRQIGKKQEIIKIVFKDWEKIIRVYVQ